MARNRLRRVSGPCHHPSGTGLSTNFSASVPMPGSTNVVEVVAQPSAAGGTAATQFYQIVNSGGTLIPLTYDADGNCTQDENGNKYQWDALNRLTQIAQGSNTYAFAYDGLGRRLTETDNGTLVKQWVWVGNRMAEERNASGAVTKRFFQWGEQIGGAAYYLTRDHLGSVREVTNSSAQGQARYDYDPYGITTLVMGSNLSDFQYAGMYLRSASSLNLTQYRAYDPNTGRWLARDPVENAEIRQGPNLYDYVRNEPIGNVDPLGLDTWGLGGTAGFGLVGGGSLSIGVFVGHDPSTGNWSFGVLGGPALGVSGPVTFYAGGFFQHTNASAVCKLKRFGGDFGWAAGEGPYAGYDTTFGSGYTGTQVTGGVGIGLPVSVQALGSVTGGWDTTNGWHF